VKVAKKPVNEKERLLFLESLEILDSAKEEAFEELVNIASLVAEAPIALISLVDDTRQWFKAKIGLDVCETSRELAFCAHAILENKPLIIEDAREDSRFSDNPLVVGEPHVIFYAGFPLYTSNGFCVGTLCVIDNKPKKLSEYQIKILTELSKQVVHQLETRVTLTQLNKYSSMMEEIHFLNNETQGNPYDHFCAYLKKGLSILGLEYGIISRVKDGQYKVIDVVGPDESIVKGFEAPLGDTYCAEVISKEKTVVFDNVGEHPVMCSHPVYVNMKLESFIGTPIIVGGEVFGTLNYSSRVIKKNRFSDVEVKFVEILSQTISKKLEMWKAQEQKNNAFHKLEDSLYKFQTLTELAPVGIFLTDRMGKAEYVNQCWLDIAGMRIKDALGEGWVNAIHPDDREKVFESWSRSAEGGKNFDEVMRFQNTFTGKIIHLRTMATPLKNKKKEVYGYLGVNLNVTNQIESEKSLVEATRQAQKASEAKTLFLANMSHEIRTPLNSIIGLSDLLSESDLGADNNRYINTLHSSSEVLLNLVNDILDLSKIEAGEFTLEYIEFSIEEVLERLMDIFAWAIQEKRLSLDYQIDKSLDSHFLGDPNRVNQILINLIGNAIKFTSEGNITITVSQNGSKTYPGDIVIGVEDTGIGIPIENQKIIFNKFDQGDEVTARKFGGTGLGLAITKKLAQLMGGTAWVESSEGSGSFFYVSLQLTPSVNEKKSADDVPDPLKGAKVIIIDDNLINLEILEKRLVSWGAEVKAFESPEEARSSIDQADFDLLLTDYFFSQSNGIELIESLLKENKLDNKKYFLLTSTDNSDVLKKFKELGGETLVKPYRKQVLLEKIKHALEESSVEPTPTTDRNLSNDNFDFFNDKELQVLLVDDSPNNRNLIKAYFKKFNITVEEACDGKEAFDKFQVNRYDIVIMDMQMPVMDGYEATQAIRTWEESNNSVRTPVVALTAFALREEQRKSFNVGCDEHLVKPVKKAMVLNTVISLLENKNKNS